jgi:uncharacterized membrane protein
VNEQLARGVLAALATSGLSVAGYLTYARWTGTIISCSTGGCETVQSSEYSSIAGVPVAVLGLGAYALLLVTAASAADIARAAGAALALAAFVFSGYLLYLQLAVIGAVCDWCVVNDAIITVLVPFAVLRLVWGGTATARP